MNGDKIGNYLDGIERGEYEFRPIHMSDKNTLAIIAGMTENAEKKLERELLHIEEELQEPILFYVGRKVKELELLHISYSQALSCITDDGTGREERIVYYQQVSGKEKRFSYPDAQLDALYDALVEAEMNKAFSLTDQLTAILEECAGNRFISASLYYDIMNTYYRAQTRLAGEAEDDFLEIGLLDTKDNPEAIRVILRVRNQFRDYIEGNGRKKGKQRNNTDFVQGVIGFIDENSKSGELCASMVAEHFGISISHMSHRFKEQTNRTISDYITEKKFTWVCELLRNTDYSVKEIAIMTGYSHQVSFIRKFKQLYEMTPMEYRGEHRS